VRDYFSVAPFSLPFYLNILDRFTFSRCSGRGLGGNVLSPEEATLSRRMRSEASKLGFMKDRKTRVRGKNFRRNREVRMCP
jgi:hypothetical protein